MKTTTTAPSHTDATPSTTTDKLNALLASEGAREFSFELRFKGKVVSGEAIAWEWNAEKGPDEWEAKQYLMERLSSKGVFPAARTAWNRAKLSIKAGPPLTAERLSVLRECAWEVKDAA